jgi:2,4-dienoyl-CoA reductase-like NADH-dependent reductase (Old Yellow Enzyme family)
VKKIFDSVKLGQLHAKNRVLRSATFDLGGGKTGRVTPFLKEIYEKLAKGGVDIAITGMMSVGCNAGLNADMIKIYEDEFVPAFKNVAGAVHRAGGKLIVQLGHCGAWSQEIDKGDHAYAPSDAEMLPGNRARAMTKDEIAELIKEYGRAAQKCRLADADGVQIHGAHGYLISEFLSPHFNKRKDEYGGALENRGRLLFDVYKEIRAKVGREYPVWVKINYSDLVEDGLDGESCAGVCEKLEELGIDAIEVSSGLAVDRNSRPAKIVKTEADEGSYAEGALALSSVLRTPVISVGGYRTPDVIEKQLDSGNIAAVSLCRPLICEPALLNRWKTEDRTMSRCTSCNKCFGMPNLGCSLDA